MSPAVVVEWQKLRRSPVTRAATGLMATLVPAMALGFFTVAMEGGTGPLAQKTGAFLIGEGWVGYLGVVDQIAAVAMFLGAGIGVAWVFGREHADRTFPSLFALPVSRGSIASAKFVVLLGWVAILTLLVGSVALTLGLVAGVGPFEVGVVGEGMLRLLAVAGCASLLALPTGLVASIGRGYLPAVGALLLVVAAAQVFVLFGSGGWFPFAVPGLIAIQGSESAPALNPVQLSLVPIAVMAGVWLTVGWWRRAEVV